MSRLTNWFTIVATLLFSMCLTQPVVAVEPGINCSTAGIIPGNGSYPWNNTNSPGTDPCLVGVRAVWFQWIAPSNGLLSLNTCDSAEQSRIRVYSEPFDAGPNCPISCGLHLVAQDTNSCGDFRASLTTPVMSGKRYYIVVSGDSTVHQGPGTLVFSFSATDNNACNPTDIAPNSSTAFDTTHAQADDPCAGGVPTRWFRFTAPSHGFALAEACGTNFNSRLTVYRAGSCPVLCHDVIAEGSGGCGMESAVPFPIVAGGTYYIGVGGATAAETGSGTLNVSFTAATGGLTCQTATAITEPGMIAFRNNEAANSVDPCRSNTKTVWHTFTAPASGELFIFSWNLTTLDNTFISIYPAGCPLVCGNRLAFSGTPTGERSYLSFDVVEGESYIIGIGGGSFRNLTSGAYVTFPTGGVAPPTEGDINNDGVVNAADVTHLANLIASGNAPGPEVADFNNDGVVNELDVQALAEMIVND